MALTAICNPNVGLHSFPTLTAPLRPSTTPLYNEASEIKLRALLDTLLERYDRRLILSCIAQMSFSSVSLYHPPATLQYPTYAPPQHSPSEAYSNLCNGLLPPSGVIPLRLSDIPNRFEEGGTMSLYPESSDRTGLGFASNLPPPSRPPPPSPPRDDYFDSPLTPLDPSPTRSDGPPPRKQRRPRQEALRDIKHMIFSWRVDPWTSAEAPLPLARGQHPKFIDKKMGPPLLCTFRVVGLQPMEPEDDDDDTFVSDQNDSPTFPYRTLSGDEGPLDPDGIPYLIDPSTLSPEQPSPPPFQFSEAVGRLLPVPVTPVKHEVHSPSYEIDDNPFALTLPPITGLWELPPLQQHRHSLPTLPTPAWLCQVPMSLETDGDAHYLSGAPSYAEHHQPHPRSGTMSSGGGSSDVLMSDNLVEVLLASVATPTPREHICHICNKSFERPSSLQTHMTVHTGEKPYVCQVSSCRRQFSVRSNLHRHLRIHHGIDTRKLAQEAASSSSSPPHSQVLDDIRRRSGVSLRGTMSGRDEEDPNRWHGRGGPVPMLGTQPQQPVVPDSLKGFHNAGKLSHRGPFDLSACAGRIVPCVPLAPVQPVGHPSDIYNQFEERNSFDVTIPDTPYHPTHWAVHPVLPGPALVSESELTTNTTYARRLFLPGMR